MRWSISITWLEEQRRQLLAQTKNGLFGCGRHSFSSSVPIACTHRYTHSIYKHALTYTQRQTRTPPPPLRELFFCVSGFLADCRCSAINSPLIEVKKQQEEEKALILEKQLRDPVDKAVFPKPQQRETPDITQSLSNSKAIFLIEVLATFPS